MGVNFRAGVRLESSLKFRGREAFGRGKRPLNCLLQDKSVRENIHSSVNLRGPSTRLEPTVHVNTGSALKCLRETLSIPSTSNSVEAGSPFP